MVSMLRGARRPGKARDALIASIAVVAVAAPLLLRSNEELDFVNHLWVVWAAGKALAAVGHPTYFINTTTQGVFNPWFAFYGGTLYEATGALSEVLGHPYVAYGLVTVFGVASSYVGTLWLGRELGLRDWTAHAPALAVVTGAFYITNLYGGAWTEFMPLSVIPLLLASGVNLLRAPAWRPGPVLAFAVAAVILTGSNDVSLVLSVTVGVFVAVVMWLALGRPRQLPYRRLAMVSGLAITAGLVNAWFLFTDLLYARDVSISTTSTPVTGAVSYFDSATFQLGLFRSAPSDSAFPGIYVQAPMWFLGWAVLAGAMLLWHHQARDVLRRAWIGGIVSLVLLLALIMDNAIWSGIPFPLDKVQFPFRLDSFVVFIVAGLVLAAALALHHADVFERRRRNLKQLKITLVAVAAVSAGLCLWQELAPTTNVPGYFVNRHAAFVSPRVLPPSWYAVDPYNDIRAPIVGVPAGRVLTIPPDAVHGDRFDASVLVPPGLGPIQTNISGGSYVVHISGLRWIGRNAAGFAVVERFKKGKGRVHLVVQTADTGAITAGWIVSVLAVVALLAALLGTAVRTWIKPRSTDRPDPAPAAT
jgi:uncharacterized integral membrane protein